jgi:hypothetical protein
MMGFNFLKRLIDLGKKENVTEIDTSGTEKTVIMNLANEIKVTSHR